MIVTMLILLNVALIPRAMDPFLFINVQKLSSLHFFVLCLFLFILLSITTSLADLRGRKGTRATLWIRHCTCQLIHSFIRCIPFTKSSVRSRVRLPKSLKVRLECWVKMNTCLQREVSFASFYLLQTQPSVPDRPSDHTQCT